jgi:hypothetical protein
MSNHFLSMALLVAGVLLQSAGVRADSFEFINYTPPRGWLVTPRSCLKMNLRCPSCARPLGE